MVGSAVRAHSFWMSESDVFTKAKQQHEGPHTKTNQQKKTLWPQEDAQVQLTFPAKSNRWTHSDMLAIMWLSAAFLASLTGGGFIVCIHI